MPRAHRHHVPGHVWHITHRCHDRQFLLKFRPDRLNWLHWLYEAVRRYRLCVLYYTVTCNHIHLIASETERRHTIPRSMQLVAGRTAEEYNARRGRRGAFWEDRYHATAVQPGPHLLRCIAYLDLNMVRAGVVSHPADWPHCAFGELHSGRAGTRILDWRRLCELLHVNDRQELLNLHTEALAAKADDSRVRQDFWTSSVAVGDREFVDSVAVLLQDRCPGRQTAQAAEGGPFVLREPRAVYGDEVQTCRLAGDNSVQLGGGPQSVRFPYMGWA